MSEPAWIKTNNVTTTFKLRDEPVLIHVIKTGFENKYMIVYEDAYDLNTGKVEFKTKEELHAEYGIEISSPDNDPDVYELLAKKNGLIETHIPNLWVRIGDEVCSEKFFVPVYTLTKLGFKMEFITKDDFKSYEKF